MKRVQSRIFSQKNVVAELRDQVLEKYYNVELMKQAGKLSPLLIQGETSDTTRGGTSPRETLQRPDKKPPPPPASTASTKSAQSRLGASSMVKSTDKRMSLVNNNNNLPLHELKVRICNKINVAYRAISSQSNYYILVKLQILNQKLLHS